MASDQALIKKLDANYFKQYAGSNKSYSKVFSDYSRIYECIEELAKKKLKVQSVLVLGAATGQVLHVLHRELGVLPMGCELVEYAYKKIPLRYRRHICLQGLCEFLYQCKFDQLKFDLVFTNSLVYLTEQEIHSSLAQLREIARFVHFHSSFQGYACRDPYRVTLKPYSWWKDLFQCYGFRIREEGRSESKYLWVNQALID